MTRQDPPSPSDAATSGSPRPHHIAAHAEHAAAATRPEQPPIALDMAAAHPWDGRGGTLRVAVWADGRAFDPSAAKPSPRSVAPAIEPSCGPTIRIRRRPR